jgi:hypothetical protein
MNSVLLLARNSRPQYLKIVGAPVNFTFSTAPTVTTGITNMKKSSRKVKEN